MEKQIEEMAKDIKIAHDEQKYLTSDKSINAIANSLYNKRWRKASDVAEEIVAIIEQRRSMNEERYKGVSNEVWQAIYNAREHAYKDLKEIIKQKYTESEGE